MYSEGDLAINPRIPILTLDEIYARLGEDDRAAFEGLIHDIDVDAGTTLLAEKDHPDRAFLVSRPASIPGDPGTIVVALIEMMADTCFCCRLGATSAGTIRTISRDDLFGLILERPAIGKALSEVIGAHLHLILSERKD